MANENKNVDEKSVEVVNDGVLTSKNKSGIYIVVGLLILIVIGIILFIIFLKPDNKKKPENINNNNNSDNNVEVPTFSDDVIVDDSIEVENKIIYIYQKGYADRGPIAYTYECESESCDLKITEKGFILYDEDVVKYREMTTYEYEQINNSEVSPVGSKLDTDGFVEVKSVYDGVEDDSYCDYLCSVYYINGKLYEFKRDDVEELILFDEEVILYNGDMNIVFNLKLKKVLISGEPDYIVHKKVNDFYIFSPEYSDSHYINCNNAEKLVSFGNSTNYYVNEDKIYYIEEKKVMVMNNKKENVIYNNDGIEAIQILDDKLLYLNSDNILCIKNLLNDDYVYSTNIKMKNATYLFGLDDSVIELYEKDYTIIENDDFDSFKNKHYILDEEINQIKSCIKNENECDLVGLGYKITLDKEGKFISKEYYYNSY